MTLNLLHHELLKLHKLLLECERNRYEQAHAVRLSLHDLLGLTLSHPDFEWLRAISKLIILIDELAEDTRSLPEEKTITEKQLLSHAIALLTTQETDEDFARNYTLAQKESPEVRAVHDRIISIIEQSNS